MISQLTVTNSIPTTRPTEQTAPDVVSQVFDRVKLQVKFTGQEHRSGRWEHPIAQEVRGFYAMLRGGCRLSLASGRAVPLSAGDLAVFLQSQRHTLQSHDPAECTFTSGVLLFPPQRPRSWVNELPEIILIRGHDGQPQPWVRNLLALMEEERRRPGPGSRASLNQLARVLLIRTVRQFLADDASASQGWLAALQDPYIGQAISLMHARLDRSWTVSGLADEVGMSRSAFAARFLETIGTPPMSYLLKVRMDAAQNLLRETNHGIRVIAQRVGYKTEAAFSTAYKRWSGVTPGGDRNHPSSAAKSMDARG